MISKHILSIHIYTYLIGTIRIQLNSNQKAIATTPTRFELAREIPIDF